MPFEVHRKRHIARTQVAPPPAHAAHSQILTTHIATQCDQGAGIAGRPCPSLVARALAKWGGGGG